jgi:acetyl esterase/lipase
LLVNWLFWPQSVAIYRDWIAAGRPAELRVYSKGGHGFGMRRQHLPSDHWIDRFADWLDVQGLLKKKGPPIFPGRALRGRIS